MSDPCEFDRDYATFPAEVLVIFRKVLRLWNPDDLLAEPDAEGAKRRPA